MLLKYFQVSRGMWPRQIFDRLDVL